MEIQQNFWTEGEEVMQLIRVCLVTPAIEIADLSGCTTLVIEEDGRDAIREITGEGRCVEIGFRTECVGGDVRSNLFIITNHDQPLGREGEERRESRFRKL